MPVYFCFCIVAAAAAAAAVDKLNATEADDEDDAVVRLVFVAILFCFAFLLKHQLLQLVGHV